MINVSLAIGDFMLMLLSSIFWTGTGLAGWGLLALGAAGGFVIATRRLLRRRR